VEDAMLGSWRGPWDLVARAIEHLTDFQLSKIYINSLVDCVREETGSLSHAIPG
jgi:hypothetical protein